jgi:SNF2 family DNA or RNA helicase
MLEILESKPNPDNLSERKAPKRLKVKLLDHQYYAINWLKWREATEPRGGILADDMGLGNI